MSGSLNASPAPSLQPTATKVTLPTNYLSDFDFLNQYLPDIQQEEVSRYGDRSIAQFLKLTGAESPFESDLIKWSESGRLHTKYNACSIAYGGGNDTATITVADLGITACNFRVGQTVFLSSNVNASQSDKAIITAVSGLTFTVAYYAAGGGTITDSGNNDITVFVYGSEFKKGSDGMQGSLEAEPNIFDVSPIILKDKYIVSGSDMAQIGWIQDENGNFLWYLKSKSETMMRFDDYMETSMIEAVPAETGSGAIAVTGDVGNKGSDGLLYVLGDRGNVWGGGNPSTLAEFDTVVKRLDKQGAIDMNMLFLNRDFDLDIDDMLGSVSTVAAGGLSYGIFENGEQMALNLGFQGFKRGGYEFYKRSWKYLNDETMRGSLVGGKVNGVLVPTGSTNVYDQVLGQQMNRPYLHVRYRMKNQENRRYKTWITGGAGGAQTSSQDAMNVDFLSERALCTVAANNFFLFEG